MTDPLNKYKLIVLHILNTAGGLLTRMELFDYMLEHRLAEYFDLQKTVEQLIESGLIEEYSDDARINVIITPQGQTTLGYFDNRIEENVKKDIVRTFSKEAETVELPLIRTEVYPIEEEFAAHVMILKSEKIIFEARVKETDRSRALAVCKKFEEKGLSVYNSFIKELG